MAAKRQRIGVGDGGGSKGAYIDDSIGVGVGGSEATTVQAAVAPRAPKNMSGGSKDRIDRVTKNMSGGSKGAYIDMSGDDSGDSSGVNTSVPASATKFAIKAVLQAMVARNAGDQAMKALQEARMANVEALEATCLAITELCQHIFPKGDDSDDSAESGDDSGYDSGDDSGLTIGDPIGLTAPAAPAAPPAPPAPPTPPIHYIGVYECDCSGDSSGLNSGDNGDYTGDYGLDYSGHRTDYSGNTYYGQVYSGHWDYGGHWDDYGRDYGCHRDWDDYDYDWDDYGGDYRGHRTDYSGDYSGDSSATAATAVVARRLQQRLQLRWLQLR
jgi:hypothetical protein